MTERQEIKSKVIKAKNAIIKAADKAIKVTENVMNAADSAINKATNKAIDEVENLAQKAAHKISSSTKSLYRKVTKSGSFDLNKSYEHSELQGRYRVTEKLVANPEWEKKKRKEKLQYAVKEFSKASPKSGNNQVSKEEQVGIDLGNKLVIDHYTGILYKAPPMFEEPAYMKEVGTRERKSYEELIGFETSAKRFSLKEQVENTKIIKKDSQGECRLFDQHSNLYDTSNKMSKGEKGVVAYAVTLDGKLVASEHIQPDYGTKYGHYHSTLLGGKPGLCFGMMKVKDGKISEINTFSGHYKPTQENLYNAAFLKSDLKNVFTDDIRITTLSTSYNKRKDTLEHTLHSENAKQFEQRMETKGSDGLTMPERYFGALRNYNIEYDKKLEQSKSSHTEKIINERTNNSEQTRSR
ncbi:hypothetical protein [Wolbachia endosymbiont of Pentidionis agamae]|uniref:hypothetical protein n=1 Tax=Wolbachia endosymbiont of Pentidionis agamae TaxID=3110435 RepID=UPI002FD2C2EB